MSLGTNTGNQKKIRMSLGAKTGNRKKTEKLGEEIPTSKTGLENWPVPSTGSSCPWLLKRGTSRETREALHR